LPYIYPKHVVLKLNIINQKIMGRPLVAPTILEIKNPGYWPDKQYAENIRADTHGSARLCEKCHPERGEGSQMA